MIKVIVPLREAFDESKNEFVIDLSYTLTLEHSLVSLSKWESLHEKPFLSTVQKTDAETLSYFQAMSLDGEIPPEVFDAMTAANYKQINDYIGAKMTATWFNDPPNASRTREIITSEVIYYWLVSLEIPFEVQHWHLNRLLTLVKVVNQKNQPPKKKMSRNELAAQNRALNAQRKAKYGTSG